MSLSIFTKDFWSSIAPYTAPPLAASIAIIPVFGDMIAKSAEQLGKPIPSMTLLQTIKQGMKAAPSVGAIVGAQMVIQNKVEKALLGGSKKPKLSSTLLSSAIVGIGSAPILAVFNGQTMGRSALESLRKFSLKQGLVITAQETAFVIGLSAADLLSEKMRESFGDTKATDYTAAYIAGALGSLAGHPANTALTRWQANLAIDRPSQLMWGAARKARAVGYFACLYKLGKEILE
ncbi:MAG: hypothetical protein COT85_05780 [Chlamydiae bacterium CG10_big_fil_rev_8_21_14_0_10_42_34]|nr:MAG: hypothetical protein COT85_05780 [Chlamydiae bacterium CG10_big_fil_rev_8_21_14_0_10_42_34]